MPQMDILQIALLVLAVAGIWAVVELILTIRKTRSAISDLGGQIEEISTNTNNTVTNINDTVDQLQPVVQKFDGIVTDLEPAAKEVQPLLEKANTALDVVTVDLASVNDILVDVSSVTDTASNVTSTVSKAANSAVSGVAGVVGKFTSGGKSAKRHRISRVSADDEQLGESVESVAPETEPEPIESANEEPSAPKTYFTYASDSEGE